MKTKTLGVIGGLGPLATAYFMELVTKMTDAREEQDHVRMILYSTPDIPDRTKYILGKSRDNPFFEILDVGNALINQGVDCIAIPCMTAHYFYDILTKRLPAVKIIHAVRETALELEKNGVRKIGVMATDGTLRSGVFHKELKLHGMEVITPDESHQAGVMSLIYDDVKAGRRLDLGLFNNIADHLRSKGSEVIILGCTELSLIKRDYLIGPGYIDAMEVLAKQSILSCGKNIKSSYDNLIT